MKQRLSARNLIIRNLKDAGCDDKTIYEYLNCYENKNEKNR